MSSKQSIFGPHPVDTFTRKVEKKCFTYLTCRRGRAHPIGAAVIEGTFGRARRRQPRGNRPAHSQLAPELAPPERNGRPLQEPSWVHISTYYGSARRCLSDQSNFVGVPIGFPAPNPLERAGCTAAAPAGAGLGCL